MTYLDRGGLLSQNKRRHQDVTIDGHGTIRIRNLTVAETRLFKRRFVGRDGSVDAESAVRAGEYLLASVLVDEHGDLMFTAADVENGLFDEMDGRLLSIAIAAAQKFTGLSEDNDYQAVEAAVKNSVNGQPNETASA